MFGIETILQNLRMNLKSFAVIIVYAALIDSDITANCNTPKCCEFD